MADELGPAPDSASLTPRRNLSLREQIFEVFEEPGSSWLAIVVSFILNMMILFSTVTFIIETHPYFRNVHADTWFIFETVCVIGFSIDFVARLLTNDSQARFWKDFMNWIDFIAIIPFYLELMLTHLLDAGTEGLANFRLIRVIRLARVLRIIKMSKAGKMAPVVFRIAVEASEALFIPMYFMFLCVIVYSSLLYYIEKPVTVSCLMKNERWKLANFTRASHQYAYCDAGIATPYFDALFPSGSYTCDSKTENCCYCMYDGLYTTDNFFADIPDGIWWSFVTIFTVGYGDKYPQTWYGRGVAMVCMASGVFMLAMPLTIVGATFNEEWENMEHSKVEAEEEENKDDPVDEHTQLKEAFGHFKEDMHKIQNEYIGKSAEEKLAMLPRFKKLRKKNHKLCVAFEEAFSLYKISLHDLQ